MSEFDAGIVVEFEVSPGEDEKDPNPEEAIRSFQDQLQKVDSKLRTGEFARFASCARLDAGPGWDGDAPGAGATTAGTLASYGPPGDMAPPPPPPQHFPTMAGETMFSGAAGGWGTQGPFDGQPPAESSHARGLSGEWQAGGSVHGDLSNAQLVDRISMLEKQLTRTAAGGASSRPPSSHGGGFGDAATGGFEARFEALERSLREEQEAARLFRQRAEQSEQKLKDREQLLVHAKEMWMKENVRASKLADALTSVEDKVADQERRLAEVADRYCESRREVKQLQRLVGGEPAGFADVDKGLREDSGLGGWEASMTGDLGSMSAHHRGAVGPAPASGASLGPTAFNSSFSRDMAGPPSRPRPSSAQSPGQEARPLSVLPLDAETNADRLRRLCQINDAILYEDDLLQIGIKATYTGMEGQLHVFFGNKSSASLQSFTVQYFVREEHALRLSASPMSQSLEADKQVVQRMTVACLEPFTEPPLMRIQFLLPDTTPRRIQLKFPVVLTKFMVGRDMSAQDFFTRWRQQHFVLNEVSSIVHIAARLRGALMHVARSIIFGGNLRMHHGIDNNPDNFVLVGQLCEQPGGSNEQQSSDRSWDVFGLGGDHEHGLSLVRVEVGNGRFTGKARVVVRSSNHTVAQALCNAVATQLAEPNAPTSDGEGANAR